MQLDTLPDHIRRPHIRPVQPLPVRSKDGQPFVALRDPSQLVQQTMVVPAGLMPMLQQLQGERSIDEIAEQLKAEVDHVAQLCTKLDEVGLLWGPTFERLEGELKERINEAGALPPQVSKSMGEDAATCRAAMEQFFTDTEDPEMDTTVTALVVPHLDYQRGWPNYAAAYHCLKGADRPDRVVILGTNHFGLGDGVIMTRWGFETPMGRLPADDAVVSGMVERLGERVVVDQLDHYGEHSIELQLPWIQYFFEDVPVVAALVPDPLAPMINEDGERVSFEEFAPALREVLDAVGGNTLFIASSDLSHVGPQFGEPRPVDDQRREDVERHDREMMSKFLTGDAEEFLGAMKWSNNPTRWCSVGNMTALLQVLQPEGVELLDYRQACDEQGMVMVTSAAMALT